MAMAALATRAVMEVEPSTGQHMEPLTSRASRNRLPVGFTNWKGGGEGEREEGEREEGEREEGEREEGEREEGEREEGEREEGERVERIR